MNNAEQLEIYLKLLHAVKEQRVVLATNQKDLDDVKLKLLCGQQEMCHVHRGKIFSFRIDGSSINVREFDV